MNSTFTTRTILRALLATSLAATGCDKSDKGDETHSDEAPKTVEVMAATPPDLIARIGVPPGPIKQNRAPAAVVASATGTIEIRAIGEEAFRAAAPNQSLFAGDQLRVAEGAKATVLFADESTAELAELTTLEIGSRVVTPDPASTTAVLSGVARFNVTPRAPAEGAFLVFTPAGLVATKGTVFGVGVAADGDARIGVEQGSVEVAGNAALDAPIQLEANHAVELAAAGTLGAPIAWAQDDWGTWRDGADAEIDVNATVAAHGAALSDLSTQLEATYAALEGLSVEMGQFEAQAAADAKANATASYEAKLPSAEVTIDASYLAALQLASLTHAHSAHAALATELYLRNPEISAWATVEPQVHAAVLWPKRLDLTAALYLEPLRMQYYVHHAHGRMRAELVGIAVPEFYAQVTPPVVPSIQARAKLKIKGYIVPEVDAVASARAVWVVAPKANWHAKLNVAAIPPRGELGFYVRPPQLRSKAMLGAKVRGELHSVFAMTPPTLRADMQIAGKAKLALGQHIHIAPPDLKAAAKARASFTGQYAMPSIAMEAPKVEVGAKLKGAASLKAKTQMKASAKAKLESAHSATANLAAGAKAKAGAAASAGASAGAGLSAGAKIELKAPKVEIKPPKASASAKGSAGFKLGN